MTFLSLPSDMAGRLLLVVAVSALLMLLWLGLRLWERYHATRAGRRLPAVGRPRLLYFFTSTCAVCPAQRAALADAVAAVSPPPLVEPIAALAQRDLAAEFGVVTVPTIIMLDSAGQVRAINRGLTPADRLRRQLTTLSSAA